MSTPVLEQLRRMVVSHAKRYPLMRPCDGVKLVYQNEFGGGHLVSDPNAALARLRTEYASLSFDSSAALLEDIGAGLARVQLAALDGDNYPLEQLGLDFIRSAQLHTGTSASFMEKLAVLRRLAGDGSLPFSLQELEVYLGPYLQSGCPPVSHSPQYRAAYRPAYRVVLRELSLPALVQEVDLLLTRQNRVLIALDGRCASGKTTLASRLNLRWGWSVVHMDHFFLRPEQRTPERYRTPGGNVDYERFLQEVLLPLRQGSAVKYRPFDCRTQQLAAPIQVAASPVTVVEGSYSCHPALWGLYDFRVFLSTQPGEQLRRIDERNTPEQAQAFRTKWIPLEEAYFSGCDIPTRCDYRLIT